jgi:hypothetical protein
MLVAGAWISASGKLRHICAFVSPAISAGAIILLNCVSDSVVADGREY